MPADVPNGHRERLNANQVRHVVSTFTHVDKVLRDVERVARDDLSPFAPERADFAPDEARLVQSFAALIRSRMLAALDRLGIPRPVPSSSARWAAQTNLTYAEIALADLGPSDLRGYGVVDEDAARELEALAADLRQLLERARHVLHEQDAGGLADRIARVRGPAGEVLRAVDAVSREHGLADVRPLLAAAVERATATTFDVGVFGRVSAGKSSLIDALIDAPVLPVGATPVTAVPIRLARGEERVTLRLLDGTTRAIALGDLAEYATEDRNPANRAGVGAIEITVPSVPVGLRLLDTPGVGSINTNGPAMAFAWLPRCDLGLVLIAAGTPVGRDDLALVTGLRQAGIRCVVLLSKSDLLSPHERARALDYVRRELMAAGVSDPASNAASPIEVVPVSTVAGHEAELGAFRTAVLAPLAADHERAARQALAARLTHLVDATGMAFARRAGRNDGGVGGSAGGPSEAAVQAQRSRAIARGRIRDLTDGRAGAGPTLLRAAIDAVTDAWERDADPRAAARAAIIAGAGASLGAVRALVDQVRGDGRGGEDTRRVPPLFDPAFLDELPELSPPLGRRLFGRAAAARQLAPLADDLARALERYASALCAWGTGLVDEATSDVSTDLHVERIELPAALAALTPALDELHRRVDAR